jgi:hypothetical protein
MHEAEDAYCGRHLASHTADPADLFMPCTPLRKSRNLTSGNRLYASPFMAWRHVNEIIETYRHVAWTVLNLHTVSHSTKEASLIMRLQTSDLEAAPGTNFNPISHT